ncbi:hypothetical protein [Spiroplasma chrysopicola]|uniref:Uncharacterized protein n=1 Tax=Spiroplasma chrysopicola DF-1 TaxID=1276227 RepID=R4UFC9_9MOLU|nr:hypothetical protein [Spiroplasma chrysopicola]AGM24845.1 hypothetical protein SCHRY_v1c02600 [Spiroplasma chrysopicola DF-1]
MTNDYNTQKLRFWAKNPRYTNSNDVSFNNIGIEDFDEYGNDIYQQNIEEYYKKFLKNQRMIDKLYELVESISKGFEPNIDEILVTKSPYLESNNIKDVDGTDIFYVLEGNRRLFALHLLSNIGISREVLEKYISSNLYLKFEKIFEQSSNLDFSIIECKIYNVSGRQDSEIWKVLNSRHFGNRKGKLNWPRGLVLSSINNEVVKFRNKNNIKNNEKLNQNEFDELWITVETFTGKKINELDFKGALWSLKCINTYNEFRPQNKILLEMTDDQISSEEDDILSEDANEINGNLISSKPFSVSSLELAFNTIKVLNSEGYPQSLKKQINLNIDIYSWKIDSNLNESIFAQVCIYLVESILNGKLNTRKFKAEYILELQELLGITSVGDAKELVNSSNSSRIRFSQVSIEAIKTLREDNIIFADSNEKRIYFEIKHNILPEVDKIYSIAIELEKRINLINDKMFFSLIYIWTKEFKSLIHSRAYVETKYYPFLLVSSLLRSTSELVQNIIVIFEPSIINDFKTKYSNYSPTWFKNHYGQHILDVINNNELKKEIEENYCRNGCEGKIILSIMNKSSANEILSFLKKLKISLKQKYGTFISRNENQIDTLLTSFANFISWSSNTIYLNRIIHKNHYIFDVVNDTGITTITSELKTNLEIVFSFLQLVLDYFKQSV